MIIELLCMYSIFVIIGIVCMAIYTGGLLLWDIITGSHFGRRKVRELFCEE